MENEHRRELKGYAIAGQSMSRERVKDDFYATPEHATRELLNRVRLYGSILEPAAGQGHISKVLHEYYPNSEIVSTDLVQREDKFNVGIQGGIDFLTYEYGRNFDNIITNPPFSLAEDFVRKAYSMVNGKVIMFAKIQFLESEKRKKLFEEYPLSSVYVFSNRVNPMRNGSPVDEKGKKWASTMCFAWFVWDKMFCHHEPIVRWI